MSPSGPLCELMEAKVSAAWLTRESLLDDSVETTTSTEFLSFLRRDSDQILAPRNRSKYLRPSSSPTRCLKTDNFIQDNLQLPFEYPESSPNQNKNVMKFHINEPIYPLGSGEAYFSSLPPATPMHIVLMGQNNQHQHAPKRVQQILKAMRDIEHHRKIGAGEGVGKPTADDSTAKTLDNTPAKVVPAVRKPIPATKKEKHSHGDTPRSKHIARRLLRDLVMKLPLRPVAEVSSKKMPPISREKHSLQLESAPRTSPVKAARMLDRQYSGNAINLRSRCSVAVQVLTHQKSATDFSAGNEKRAESLSDDWVGGVRALRDSHVRLVLRQLRHIDRLNRALDRCARTSSQR